MVRSFKHEALPPGTADRLLKIANRAPSAGFRLERDEAPHPIPYWYIDTGFTALLTLLAVVDEGLGAVFFGIGGPAEIADFRARYGVPPEWEPIGALAIGYPDPDTDPVPPARPSGRKPLAELVHRGRW